MQILLVTIQIVLTMLLASKLFFNYFHAMQILRAATVSVVIETYALHIHITCSYVFYTLYVITAHDGIYYAILVLLCSITT